MAQFVNIFDVDLKKSHAPVRLNQMIASGNHEANRIGANVYDNGQPAALNGQCSGLVLRADGTTVPITGTISGNQAYIVLDQSACEVPGDIQVAVNWVSGDNITTLLVAYGVVIQTDSGAYIQPSEPIPDITQLLAEIDAMRQATEAAEAAATKSVRYDIAQALSDAQKATARRNVDAAAMSDVDDLKSAISNMSNDFATDASIWESGTILLTDGSNFNIDIRIRTITYIPENVLAISCKTGYKFVIVVYNESGTCLGGWNGSVLSTTAVWLTEKTVLPVGDYKFKVVLANTSDTDIAPSAGVNAYVSFITDEELKTNLTPADALVTGMGISELYNIKARTFTNLFNLNDSDVVDGQYYNADGYLVTADNYSMSGFIPVEPFKNYSVSGWYAGSHKTITFWDANKNFVIGYEDTPNAYITTPLGAKYARIIMYTSSKNRVVFTEGKEVPPSGLPYNETKYIFGDVHLDTIVEDVENTKEAIPKLMYPVKSISSGAGWVDIENGSLKTETPFSYKYKKIHYDSNECYVVKKGAISGVSTAMLNYYDSSNNYLGYEYQHTTTTNYENVFINPPEGTDYFIVVTVGEGAVVSTIKTEQSYWSGKKILWLGTSIPATPYPGGNAYPQIVGEIIGATVINNALSGSFARRRFDPAHIDDPTMANIDMNWGMRSLSTSKSEIDDIVLNWSTYKSHFANAPDTLPASTVAEWKSWSYETILDPFIEEADLIVFDIGRNDYASVMNDPNAPYDKYYFTGAMDFLIKHIYEIEPRKRICMISHYENQDHGEKLFHMIVENQIIVSDYWSIPIFRLDKMLGWSNKIITTNHDWVQHDGNWYFEETENSHTMPMYHVWMQDDLHPNTDASGEAINLIAGLITEWIKTVR